MGNHGFMDSPPVPQVPQKGCFFIGFARIRIPPSQQGSGGDPCRHSSAKKGFLVREGGASGFQTRWHLLLNYLRVKELNPGRQ